MRKGLENVDRHTRRKRKERDTGEREENYR
jgi:hypothetical protein